MATNFRKQFSDGHMLWLSLFEIKNSYNFIQTHHYMNLYESELTRCTSKTVARRLLLCCKKCEFQSQDTFYTDWGNDIDFVKKGASYLIHKFSLWNWFSLFWLFFKAPTNYISLLLFFGGCFPDSKWAKLKFPMATFAPLSRNQDLRASSKSFISWLIEGRREIERVRMEHSAFISHHDSKGRMEPQESPLKPGVKQLCQSQSLCSVKRGFVRVHKCRFPLC